MELDAEIHEGKGEGKEGLVMINAWHLSNLSCVPELGSALCLVDSPKT